MELTITVVALHRILPKQDARYSYPVLGYAHVAGTV